MNIEQAKDILYGPGSPARVMPWDNIKLGIEGARVLLENLKYRIGREGLGEALSPEQLIPVLDLMIETLDAIYQQTKKDK